MLGWDEDGQSPVGEVAQACDRNAVGYYSATPLLRLARHPGGTRLLATLVVLTSDPQVHEDVPGLRGHVRVFPASDGTIEVLFPDGTSACVPGGPLTADPGVK
ncbi:hypothetical protein [Streptomyces pratensis]|uniref:hypothetical protein n=1 Tax=Streptomyces pratensis TaxID=1169025 RepID=UPI001EE43DF8|nr:hypothetical protein [Streptomyces pratensis]